MTYSNADFTPDMKGYSNVKPFRFWCQKVLPLVYDDSLSYYELLCKVVDYLNNVISDLSATEDNVGDLLTAYNQLQDYVNNYFTNLDVQEEINNKLDDLVEDGTLTRLIGNYVQPYLDDFQEQMDTYEENLTNDFNDFKDTMTDDFSTLQYDTTDSITTQNSRISVLEGRMDTFSSLTQGSTTGDAELQDIRVAYTGRVYPTAGDAVRAQAENINTRLSNVISDNYHVSSNLLNKNAITEDADLREGGNTASRSGYFTTDYMPIDQALSFWRKNGNTIVQYGAFKCAQYDSSFSYISGSYTTSSGLSMYSVNAAENAKFARISFANTYLDTDIGCYEGLTAPQEIEPYGKTELIIPDNSITTNKLVNNSVTKEKIGFFIAPNILYTFEDAFVHWQNGEKFPVMFCGDSTTDGPNTPNNDIDNPTDFIDTDSYPYILQGLLRSVTNNNILRCYNAGYSGKTIRNFIDAYDNIMTVYGDAKMAGISFGINDVATDPFYYYDHGSTLGFITKLCNLVEMFYEDGIQPFMITSQVICQNSLTTHREQYRVQQWCNKAKYEVAKKYGIPCVDIAEMTQLFNLYSAKSSSEIYQNLNHYSAIGHQYEAGVFFKEFYPLVRPVNGKTIVGVGDMYLKTDIGENIEMISTDTNGFKFQWNATNLETNVVILDSWVFIENKGEMQLTGYCSSAASQVVSVDGNNYTMNDVSMDICKLDVGLHHIQVTSNTQSSTNFKGLIIQ